MPEVFVGIGSNVEPGKHLAQAVDLLRTRFGGLRLSPVYRNRAVSFQGDDFLNAVASFDTALDVAELNDTLDAIEIQCGRKRGAARFAPRTLDLDLLLYGDMVDEAQRLPRREILEYAFVLKPLVDLAGGYRHPLTKRTYAEHWAGFAGERGGLTSVSLPASSS